MNLCLSIDLGGKSLEENNKKESMDLIIIIELWKSNLKLKGVVKVSKTNFILINNG
jgi:hypothetical protein